MTHSQEKHVHLAHARCTNTWGRKCCPLRDQKTKLTIVQFHIPHCYSVEGSNLCTRSAPLRSPPYCAPWGSLTSAPVTAVQPCSVV